MDFDGGKFEAVEDWRTKLTLFLELIFLELFKGKCCGADEGG